MYSFGSLGNRLVEQISEIDIMKDASFSIFRADAVRRYIERQQESVLPRLVSPPTFVCLWILLVLLLVGVLIACFARLPVYASGRAVVVGSQGNQSFVEGDIFVVAFLPPETLSRLHVGQALLLHVDAVGERLNQPIIAVEPQIISPDAAQKRFALGSSRALPVTEPSAVAIARLELSHSDLPAASYVGSVCSVDIEVGSRRAISLLPVIGQLVGG